MGTIRFVLRNDKPDANGLSPIQLVYQVKGHRKYFSTNHKLLIENWDSDSQKGIYFDTKQFKKIPRTENEKKLLHHLQASDNGLRISRPGVDYGQLLSKRDIDDLNSKLGALRSEIADIEKRFTLNGQAYSAEMVIDGLKSNRAPIMKKRSTSKELFAFIDQYIDDHKSTRKPGSLTVYKSLKRHLQEFEAEAKAIVTFESIDYAFFQQFQNFLIDRRKLNNTTVAKQLSTIKTFINYARLQGIPVSDKYKDFKIRKENLEVIALTNEEFEQLFYLDLSGNKKLAQVRDVFCFSCVTGLRYSDLRQLNRVHIGKDEIRLVVTKTTEPLTIPLNPYSRAILDKYSERLKPLPVKSSQRMNEYIKDLCKLAKINDPVEIVRYRGAKRESNTYPKHELISMHTGRKTFATLSLERGMSAEEVMAITGHLDYRSFKRYVKITDARKKLVMGNAWRMKDTAEVKKASGL